MTQPITPADVMQWLETVTDPEIPVLSIVDLGIVRGVEFDHGTCVVTITPTYSGCPAMQEITQGIESCLEHNGVSKVQVKSVLSPAWSTDWMTDKGRAALQSYGIAPPREQAINISGILNRHSSPVVPCPLCGSKSTQLVSYFGSTSCKALYRCMSCSEPFDYFKAH